LNTRLPDEISVVAAEEAPPDLHARFSARSRTYRYRIFNRRTPSPFELRRSLWVPRRLDEEGLRAAAALLAGEHDFRAFTPTVTNSSGTAIVPNVADTNFRFAVNANGTPNPNASLP